MVNEPTPIFPLNFTQCPNCESENRMAGTVLKQEKAKGKLKKEVNAWLFAHQSIVAGQPGTWISAPVITSYYDACVDCGTVYCVHAGLGTVVPGGKVPPPQFGNN